MTRRGVNTKAVEFCPQRQTMRKMAGTMLRRNCGWRSNLLEGGGKRLTSLHRQPESPDATAQPEPRVTKRTPAGSARPGRPPEIRPALNFSCGVQGVDQPSRGLKTEARIIGSAWLSRRECDSGWIVIAAIPETNRLSELAPIPSRNL